MDAAIAAIHINGVEGTGPGRSPPLTDEIGEDESAVLVGGRKHIRLKGGKGDVDARIGNAVGVVVDDPHRQVPSNVEGGTAGQGC